MRHVPPRNCTSRPTRLEAISAARRDGRRRQYCGGHRFLDIGFAGVVLGAIALYMIAVFLLVTTVFDQEELEVFGFSTLFGTPLGL